MEWYEKLANAIVVLAVKDYRHLLRKLKKHPRHPETIAALEELDDFFTSRWFGILCDLDGETLIRRLIASEEKEDKA